MLSLRLIVEQILLGSPAYAGLDSLALTLSNEPDLDKLAFPKPANLYASNNNPGATAAASEISNVFENVHVTNSALPQRRVKENKDTIFVLYLNAQTWLNEAGLALADEVRAARAASVDIIMLHENDSDKGGCEFGLFFTTTPSDLIIDGLYNELALACYKMPHRKVSLALAAQAMGATDVKRMPAKALNRALTSMKQTFSRIYSKWLKEIGTEKVTVAAPQLQI